MNKYIITYTIILTFSIFTGCSISTSPENSENTSWVFVANEGDLGDSNGSISMINEFGEVYFSSIKPKSVKAWKLHKKMTLNIVVPVGKVRFALFDDSEKKIDYAMNLRYITNSKPKTL